MSRTLSCAEVLVGSVCVLIVGVIVFPVFGSSHHSHRPACLSMVKQMALGEIMYASDEENRFPDAARWVDLTLPYTRNLGIYHCSELPAGQFGFAMHDAMSKAKVPSSAAKSLLLFESTDTRKNAHGGLIIYAAPGRHRGMSAVAYADGHAKMIARGRRP